MGRMKYPIIDEDFFIKCLGASKNDEERGLLLVGFLYGMHPSSVERLDEDSIKKEGNKHYLYWTRPKTNKTLRGEIPGSELGTIRNFITDYRRKSRQQYDNIIKRLCERAGYEGVSMMSLRHSNCLYQHCNRGVALFSLHHVMGCTAEVVSRNYTQANEEIERGFRYKIPWE